MVVSRLHLAAVLDRCALEEEGVWAVAPSQETAIGFCPTRFGG